VSGDGDLLDLKEYQGIKIINAKEYLKIAEA
jgi:predicted nucleic acid-binding protein